MQLYNNLFKKIIEIKYKRPFLYYETHHTNIGWGGVNIEHFNNFDENNKYEIQAIKINFSNKFYDIIYSVYTIEDGWFTEVRTGQLSGTIGKNRFIRGIYINFLESPNNLFNITYRCYSNNSWSDWFKNGDKIICDYPITLLQIKLDNNMCLFT